MTKRELKGLIKEAINETKLHESYNKENVKSDFKKISNLLTSILNKLPDSDLYTDTIDELEKWINTTLKYVNTIDSKIKE